MSRMAAAALTMVLAAAPAGCGGGAGPSTPPGITATPSGGPPGSALVDGLRSPPGTLLLGGAAFWRTRHATALMLVTGDPVGAFRDLVEQAQTAGFGVQAQFTVGPCWVSTTPRGWWHGPGVPFAEPLPSGVTGLGCAVAGWSAPHAGASRFLSLRLLVGATDAPYLAHLSLEYAVADETTTVETPAPPVRFPALASPLRPRPLTQVVGPGSVLGPPFNGEQALHVAAGSRLVAPPFPADCAAGGFVAVLAVTGALGPVVDAYAAQFAEAGLDEQDRQNLATPSGDATYLHAGTAGGGEATLTALAADGGGYALIDRCQD